MIASAENELIDQQVIAHQKRGFHGFGRYLEGLYDKGGAEQPPESLR